METQSEGQLLSFGKVSTVVDVVDVVVRLSRWWLGQTEVAAAVFPGSGAILRSHSWNGVDRCKASLPNGP